ncbi:EXS-domain-containing protein [Xylariomycetidae sp. FL0641]|nr:EXS-domain-containing protein [Xylariomycetidae sp. FL0641]
MDFSLLQPDSRNPYLRNILGLKKRWVYYCIMVIDPILRFSWIFYAIFTHDKQHSTFVSFLVALAEATRRGIWALLRVENEHCSNVSQYKASRDVPLPYHLEQQPLVGRESPEEDEESSEEALASAVDRVGASQRSRDQTRAGEPPQTQPPTGQEESGIRRRRKPELARARSIRGIMADAHREDFVKKKRPTDIPDEDEERAMEEIRSDEEDDEDDSGSNLDESMELRQAKALAGGKGSVKDVE